MNRLPLLIIILTSLAGAAALLPIALLGVVIGPQDLHYYNLTIILFVALAVIVAMSKVKFKELAKFGQMALFTASLGCLLLFATISKFWIDNRYGYSNWNFKNPFTIYFDRDETNAKFTLNVLDCLMQDITYYYEVNGRYPESLDDLPEKDRHQHLKDCWNNLIDFKQSQDSIVITSSGIDGKINTKDDLIKIMKKTY